MKVSEPTKVLVEICICVNACVLVGFHMYIRTRLNSKVMLKMADFYELTLNCKYPLFHYRLSNDGFVKRLTLCHLK